MPRALAGKHHEDAWVRNVLKNRINGIHPIPPEYGSYANVQSNLHA
jgi:hypothetical protein